MFLIGDNRPGQNIAVSGEIFRQTVHDHMRAQFERTHHQRRRKRTVYNQRRTALRAIFASSSIAPTRSSGLEIVSMKIQPGASSATAARTASRSQMSMNRTRYTKRAEYLGQQLDRRAIQRIGRKHRLPAIEQRRHQRDLHGHHPG